MSLNKAVVIGLGKIGMEYDFNDSPKKAILTHAQAFANHPHFQLVGGMDINLRARKRFEKKFNLPAFASLKEILIKTKPEVVCLSVPTALHKPVFDELIQIKNKFHVPVRAIICEKPIALSLKDSEQMVAISKSHSILLMVNYMRRFDPGIIRTQKLLKTGFFGDIYKATVWYSKGLLNNGSHLLDLCKFWMGDASEVIVMNKGRRWDGIDPEPDLKIKFGNTDTYFLSAKEECFTYSEIEIFGTKGKLSYTSASGNISYRLAAKDPIHGNLGYRSLQHKAQSIPGDALKYQKHLLDSLYKSLKNRSKNGSNAKAALETLKLIERIDKSALGAG